jgi:hypothetical protein
MSLVPASGLFVLAGTTIRENDTSVCDFCHVAAGKILNWLAGSSAREAFSFPQDSYRLGANFTGG